MHSLQIVLLEIIPETGKDNYVNSSGLCDRSTQLQNSWTNPWSTLGIEGEILQQLRSEIDKYLKSYIHLLTMLSERKRDVGIFLSHDDYLYCRSLD